MPLSNLYANTGTASSASSTSNQSSSPGSELSAAGWPDAGPDSAESSKASSRAHSANATTQSSTASSSSSSGKLNLVKVTNCNNRNQTNQQPAAANQQQQQECARDKALSGFAQTGRGTRKRVMANERERERTKSLNQALEVLRNRLPAPEAEKRSKIQTLRMARDYIEFLASAETSIRLEACQPENVQQQHQHLISLLTYKFYKFRLKRKTRS